MQKIDLDKLAIYNKYEGEEALMHERWADKKDLKKTTAEEFGILAAIVDNLTMLRTNMCSKEYTAKLKAELERDKAKVTEAVFNHLAQSL